jgi:hypothetical protein
VILLNTVPVCLSANAPKQNMFPSAVELSSAMMLTPGGLASILGSDVNEASLKGSENYCAPYAGPG